MNRIKKIFAFIVNVIKKRKSTLPAGQYDPEQDVGI